MAEPADRRTAASPAAACPSVSNGGCGVPEAVRRVQSESLAEAWDIGGRESGSKTIPRRSSLVKEGSRSGRDRKKTVSFSSSLSEKKISSAADCIHAMVEGTELKKVRPSSRVYHRYFLLDSGLTALCWEPSKKESDKARISLDMVREVRTGRNTDTFRSSAVYEQISEDCAFSIIYGELYDSLDLVALSAEAANIWVTGLRYLLQYGRQALELLAHSQDSLRLGWLQDMFSSAEEAERLEEDEQGLRLLSAVRLIQGLNPGVSHTKLEQRFREIHRTREKNTPGLTNGGEAEVEGRRAGRAVRGERVTKQDFIQVFHDFCTRPEIYFMLVQFSSNKEHLDSKDLMRFLEAEQGMAHVSEDTALRLIQAHEPSAQGRRQGFLSLDGFSRFLTSAECHVFDRDHKIVCQDMSQPLSHYFISSSHNTYLIEDQYRGPSDLSGYIRALRMGCRCVEVDVWDGEDDEPIVCAGHTLSPPLMVHMVLEAIGRFAFVASDYPLILCLENHCSLRQQRVLLRHLRGILGDKLYRDTPQDGDLYLPSPQALKHRILLKGKKLGSCTGTEEGEVSEEDEGAEMVRKMKAGEKEQKNASLSVSAQASPLKSLPKKFKLLRELSDLVTLCSSVRFEDFQTSARTQRPWEMCSLHEAQALRFAGEHPGEFVNHNKHFLTRVYPSPMRVDSSNMNPLDVWKCGVQLVSMNFQTAGLMMDLTAAWFRQNGNCGYVLRPAIMRQEVSYFSAETRDSVPGVSPQLLHIKVISGQNLPKPKGSGAKGDVVDPYVFVEVHGIPADCTERKTRTVTQNGDNPIFDESFEFQINLPELAMVRFVVLDDHFIGDEFIGQYTLPLECLLPGYRHVPLQSLTGEDLPHARLFIHAALTNRRGGGKPHKRGQSVRKARKSREYTALRDLGVRPVDEVFRTASPLLREATDLRENLQTSIGLFREVCGVSAVSSLMQCVLALSSSVWGPDGAPLLLFDLRDQYPTLEPVGPLPDILRRLVCIYELMIQAGRAVVEQGDGLYQGILHIQTSAMEFHEGLQVTAAQDGLRGRKVTRALESFSWNITILKGQADLLKRAKAEVQESMKQIHDAAVTGNLSRHGPRTRPLRTPSRASPDHRTRTIRTSPEEDHWDLT